MYVFDIISLLKSGYEYVNGLIPAFNRAYNRALKKWTINDSLRTKYADNYFSDWNNLVKYVENPESVDKNVLSFMSILLEEVKVDAELAGHLSAEFLLKGYHVANSLIVDSEHVIRKQNEHIGISKRIESMLLKQAGHDNTLNVIYKDVDDYIPLTVKEDEAEDERFIGFLRGHDTDKYLSDLIIEGVNRLILFSPPQCGKSTVLNKLAYDLQKSGLYVPFLFNLRDYSPQMSLEAQMHLSHRLDNSDNSVLILDGLDEIKENNRDTVISEISTISANYPLINIVLSCRLSHKKVITVSGFKSVNLNPMKYDDVRRYVQGHCLNSDSFLSVVMNSSIMELLYVPFFLKESLSYFNENGNLPKDKVTIYDYFIDRCFDVDKNRKSNRSRNLSLKRRLYKHLEYLAFVMMSSQRLDITLDEMVDELGMEEGLVEDILGLSLFTRSEDGKQTFVHNAFKEFILAKKLSNIDTERIKSLVCYPDSEIIVPALRNVVVLLIHIIRIKNEWDKSDFKDWFVEKYPEILVEVGPECLDNGTRESVFSFMFNEHKKKGLRIDYMLCRQWMNFSSSINSIRFLISEIKDSISCDNSCINALCLIRYADFSLIDENERNNIVEQLLSLLKFENLKISDYSYIARPFENRTLLNNDVLRVVFSRVQNTENNYMVQMICSMAVSLDLVDDYSDWVFAKLQFVCDFYEDGVKHAVCDYELDEFLRALCLPKNIVNAIKKLMPYGRYDYVYTYEHRLRIVSVLLKKLSLYKDEVILHSILEIIDSSYIESLSRADCAFLKEYFESVIDADSLFDKRMGELLTENRSNNKTDDYDKYTRRHNVLSVLLTEERLLRLIGKDIDDFAVLRICYQLKMYSARSEEEQVILSGFIKNNEPRKEIINSAQTQFDILFDRRTFKEKLLSFFSGVEELDFEQMKQDDLWEQNNSSVIKFLMTDIDEGKKVRQVDVIRRFEDEFDYSLYVIERLPVSSIEKILVSKEQKNEICKLIRFLLPHCTAYYNLAYYLIRSITYYDIPLEDEELMTLFPWAGVEIRDYHKDDSFSSVLICFIDYLYEKIADKKLIVSAVKSVLAGCTSVDSGFYESIIKYIVTYRISDLYASIPELMRNVKGEYLILNCSLALLELGNLGYSIMDGIIYTLSEDHRLTFYVYLLFNKNIKVELSSKQLSDVLDYVEKKYEEGAYLLELRRKALRILLANGRVSALKWCMDLLNEDETWIYEDDFPSIQGYKSEHFYDLECLFKRAVVGSRVSYLRPHPVYESVSSALKNIAMESIEMLEKVKSLFRMVASENKDFRYYNRIADELDSDYYSCNIVSFTLHQASEYYRKVFI